MSFDPPGAKGTTRRTGRVGRQACARATFGAKPAAKARPKAVLRCIMVAFLPVPARTLVAPKVCVVPGHSALIAGF
jgi:hypothetical protein